MTLFLDSSVLRAACGSPKGASREIFRRAPEQQWTSITIPYVLEEVARNLKNLPSEASANWVHFAWADVLLTLDTSDFGELLDSEFYGLAVLRPGAFLERERAMNRLR